MSTRRLIHADYRLYMLLIVALATFLRLYHLNYQSLWYDELHSVIPTKPSNTVSSIIEYSKYDQPPGFFLILHFWFKLFAYTEFYARLLPALIGVAGVVAIFFLGKEIRNTTVGVTASFITAINWFHLFFSQDVRFYSLLFLLATLSYLFLLRIYKRGGVLNYIPYTVCAILLLYTHYYGMAVVATQALLFLWLMLTVKRHDKKFIFSVIASGMAVAAAFAPWLPVILHDNAARVHWMVVPEWYFLAVYYWVYLGKDIVLVILYTSLAIVYLYYAFTTFFERQLTAEMREEKRYFIILCVWIACSYLFPLLYTLTKRPIMHERYTIIAFPAIVLVFALGFERLKNVKARTFIIAAVFLSTTVNLLFVKKYYTEIVKNQFREVVQEVIRRNNGVRMYSNQSWHYNFYFEYLGSPYRVTDNYKVDFGEALAGQQSVWVLHGHITRGISDEQQQYLDENFVLKEQLLYQDAKALLYQRRTPRQATGEKPKRN